MGHPIAKAKAVAPASRFLYLYMLAEQEDKLGESAAAAAYYERALKMGPVYPEGVLNYVDFLTRSGEYDRALELIDRLKSDGGKAVRVSPGQGTGPRGQGALRRGPAGPRGGQRDLQQRYPRSQHSWRVLSEDRAEGQGPGGLEVVPPDGPGTARDNPLGGRGGKRKISAPIKKARRG